MKSGKNMKKVYNFGYIHIEKFVFLQKSTIFAP